MVFLSSRISPLTSTVIFLVRSPLATAMVTSAMLRTCPVRLDAIELTLSVRSFQVPATPVTSAWPPSLPSVPTSRAIHRDLLRQVAVGDGDGHLGDVPDLAGQVGRHQVDVVREVLPGAGDAGHHRLSAELAVGTHFTRDARHLRGERIELVDHGVDGVLQL